MQLKVLSWNIWYDGNFGRIAQFLKNSEADIIGLQEVVPDDPRRDVVGYLAKLSYSCALAPVLKLKDGRMMSNAVFSKYPITASAIYNLSEIDSRKAIRADLSIDEKILSVFSTHLLHTHQQLSNIQIAQVNQLIAQLPVEHTVVMGDFNATPDSVVIRKMRKAMVDAALIPNPTVYADLFDCLGCDTSTLPNLTLDYIFVSKDIQVSGFQVCPPSGSDHLPISAVIKF